ncbi:peroxidase family protein [Anianabacter salinae]|uniref:hypothetical protein n=1 Tax=Anianabacter salinae TaxID=2851023 RepID=UPI00225E3212|nr:hypothetical protein [Anianabacter salinae]MBV0911127.1 hypothetical protein [Anianabacter salinae]
MLFYTAASQFALPDEAADHSGAVSVSAACGFSKLDPVPDSGAAGLSPMGYFLDRTTNLAPAAEDKILHLATRMARIVQDRAPGIGVPAIQADIARFLFNDTCAPVLRAAPPDGQSGIGPLPRPFVEASLSNLRCRPVALESVYGGARLQGSLAWRLRDVLTDPDDPRKLRVGKRGRARDLLRLRDILSSGPRGTFDDLARFIPPELGPMFFDEAGQPLKAVAVVADQRHAADMRLSRILLAVIDAHNSQAERAGSEVAQDDPLKGFGIAQSAVVRGYRRMLRDEFLPAVADPITIEETQLLGARVYRQFKTALKGSARPGVPTALEVVFAILPVIQLLSVDAGAQCLADHLRKSSVCKTSDPLGFQDGPALTSVSGGTVSDILGGALAGSAPHDNSVTVNPERQALRDFIRHHIALGQRLNLPSAEDCINALQLLNHHVKPPEYDTQMRKFGLDKLVQAETPLFVYLWVEAQVVGKGRKLGPLGSKLLAEHLIGQLADTEDALTGAGADNPFDDAALASTVTVDALTLATGRARDAG